MPIYEYRCINCGHIFDKFQSMGADNSNVECPECATPRPERLFSAFASGGNTSGGSSFTSAPSGCGTGGFS